MKPTPQKTKDQAKGNGIEEDSKVKVVTTKKLYDNFVEKSRDDVIELLKSAYSEGFQAGAEAARRILMVERNLPKP